MGRGASAAEVSGRGVRPSGLLVCIIIVESVPDLTAVIESVLYNVYPQDKLLNKAIYRSVSIEGVI